MNSMWKQWLSRLTTKSGRRSPGEFKEELTQAILEAKAREAVYKPLFEQLAFAVHAAESRTPIDRQTVPIHLALGPGKLKELAAQIKLSSFLRSNIGALIHHFRENQRDLRNAEKAANLLAEHSTMKIRPEAVLLVRELFQFLNASKEKFRDYPLFYQLLNEPNEGEETAFTPIPEELQYLLTHADVSEPLPERLGLFDSTSEFSTASVAPSGSLFSGSNIDAALPAPLMLTVGIDLLPLVDPSLGSEFIEKIALIRDEVAQQMGFILPALHFRYSDTMAQSHYAIQIRGNTVATGDIMTGYHLAIPLEAAWANESETAIVGFPTVDPVTGRSALWVTRQEGRRAAKSGYDVTDPSHLLVRHIKVIAYNHAADLLSLEDVSMTLNHLRERIPVTVESLIPEKIDIADYHQILKALLHEKVSIRDQTSILECLNHKAKALHPFYLSDRFGDGKASMESLMLLELSAQIRPLTEASVLTELVRHALSRQICESLADEQSTIDVINLSPSVEAIVIDAIQTQATGQVLQLPTAKSDWLVGRILLECQNKDRPVLICDSKVRPFIKQLTTRAIPALTVLARSELHASYRIQVVGTITPTDH